MNCATFNVNALETLTRVTNGAFEGSKKGIGGLEGLSWMKQGECWKGLDGFSGAKHDIG